MSHAFDYHKVHVWILVDLKHNSTTRAVTPEQTYEQVYKETHGYGSNATERPKTGAVRKQETSLSPFQGATLDSLLEEFGGPEESSGVRQNIAVEGKTQHSVESSPPPCAILGRTISFSFLTTWGDPHFMGLTSLEVLVWQPHMEGLPYKVVPLSLEHLEASPPDINVGGFYYSIFVTSKNKQNTNKVVSRDFYYLCESH